MKPGQKISLAQLLHVFFRRFVCFQLDFMTPFLHHFLKTYKVSQDEIANKLGDAANAP